MENETIAIIEIGSTNTKTNIYRGTDLIFRNSITIEIKKNYKLENKVQEKDFNKLLEVIKQAFKYTKNVHLYGCSIFRNMEKEELNTINYKLKENFNIEIEVLSQEDEALYTAKGCYGDISYDGNICVFIGGGGSIELILANKGKVIDKKLYNFGVVDVTRKFESLKNDVPNCTFDEVYSYIQNLIGDINFNADLLILAGGDHIYWYENAKYEMLENTLYESSNQKYMITKELSDKYDKDAMVTSLDKIRNNSDNPLWFDASRAMKIITNYISNSINAKYIIPTRINMEEGIKLSLLLEEK